MFGYIALIVSLIARLISLRGNSGATVTFTFALYAAAVVPRCPLPQGEIVTWLLAGSIE